MSRYCQIKKIRFKKFCIPQIMDIKSLGKLCPKLPSRIYFQIFLDFSTFSAVVNLEFPLKVCKQIIPAWLMRMGQTKLALMQETRLLKQMLKSKWITVQ